MLSSASVALLQQFPGWQAEEEEETKEVIYVQPFPSPLLQRSVKQVLSLATVSLLTAQVLQATAAFSAIPVVEEPKYGSIQAQIGVSPLVLNGAALVLLIGATVQWYNTQAQMEALDKTKAE
jgi:hypothetical protein